MKHGLCASGALMLAVLLVGAPSIAAPAQGFKPTLRAVQRDVLPANLAHYRYDLQVGPGEYDRIRVHRVVKEQSPGKPGKLADAIMFFPGQPTYFDTLYIEPLISKIGPERSIAVYLAKQDLDVWGMDYRWALVPVGTANVGTIMRDWGVDQDIADGLAALAFARQTRGTNEPLILTGLSYGALMTYGVAGADTQLPPARRMVRGLIPLDFGVKFDDPDAVAASCNMLDYDITRMSSPDPADWYSEDGLLLSMVGDLAISDPDGDSPMYPGLTNAEFAIALLVGPNAPVDWHFMGGAFDAYGMPHDLRFTEPRLAFDLLKYNEPPYYPWKTNYDVDAAWCDGSVDVLFDDHLGDIDAPIFYVGAAGGFGVSGIYTTGLTASPDVKTLIVQDLPNDQRYMDYGHADLLTGKHAQPLVWKPILDWIKAHR